MAGRVLSDASPLIGLGYVDGLHWLQQLFGAVWIPQEVNAELINGQGFAGEAALLQAQSDGWLRLAGLVGVNYLDRSATTILAGGSGE